MRIRSNLALIVAGVTLISAVSAPSASAQMLKIEDFTTPKGIKVWLVEDRTVPVVSLKFLFQGAGSVNDPADKQGLSQILSNTLDEGAGDLDAKQFQEALNDHSIALRFNSSRDDFGGSLKTLTKYKSEAFDLLRLALTEPKFDDDALRRMRDANIARIKSSMTDPDWLSARLMNAAIYGDHPYSRNSGGTLSSLPRITADDLRAKLKNELGRDRLIIAIAGQISRQDAEQDIDRVFANLPDHTTVKSVETFNLADKTRMVQFDKSIPQTSVNIVFPGIPMDDKDYFAAQIFDYVLGGAGFGSRLMDVVREQNGLTYGIDSGLMIQDHAQLFTISTSTRAENVPKILELINQEVDRMKTTQISAKELSDAKSYLIGSVPLGLTSTDRISGMMIGFQAYNLPPNYLDVQEAGLRSVTPVDVLRVAKRVLETPARATILLGPDMKADNIEKVAVIPDIE